MRVWHVDTRRIQAVVNEQLQHTLTRTEEPLARIFSCRPKVAEARRSHRVAMGQVDKSEPKWITQ